MSGRHEFPDTTPIEVPVAAREMTLQEMVAAYVKQQVFLHDRGVEEPESIEEAEDFNVDEDFEPPSPYEFHAMVAEEFDRRKSDSDAKRAVRRFVKGGKPQGTPPAKPEPPSAASAGEASPPPLSRGNRIERGAF